MANTYTQIHLQAVFVVKYRSGMIQPMWEEQLYKYITGIVQSQNHKMLAINGMPDHVHLLFGMRPTQSLSDLMQDVKGSSSKWINENGLVPGRFEWQSGYGAFSYCKSKIPTVINYIKTQKDRHKTFTVIQEYRRMLTEVQLDFDGRYIFTEPQ